MRSHSSRRLSKSSRKVGQRNQNEESIIGKKIPMKGLYQVTASVVDSKTKEHRVIMSFHAIVAYGKEDAISKCKNILLTYLSRLPKYRWEAKSEWEENLGVN